MGDLGGDGLVKIPLDDIDLWVYALFRPDRSLQSGAGRVSAFQIPWSPSKAWSLRGHYVVTTDISI